MASDNSRSDEETALLGIRRRQRGTNQHDDDNDDDRRRCSGLTFDRIVLLLLLSLLVALSIFYQSRLNTLSLALDSERERTNHLDEILQSHDSVIRRFNASITNADVVKRMDALEKNFTESRQHVENELVQVKKDIDLQLKDTINDLNASVSAAKQAISNEVDKVKADVESYIIDTEAQFSMENSFMVYQIAGTFTLLTCLISMWHMTAHLRKMNQPDVQRKILAILWMSPIYAITSWFSLLFVAQAEGYLAIIKDGYEAYIIYQFLAFCIAVLGKGDRNVVVDLLARRADHLTPPFRLFGCFEICGCCKPEPFESNRALADAILLQCQVFALQFVFFRPVITTAMVVLAKLEYYGAGTGPSDYRSPQFYLTIVQNISIFVAFAGLLKFYHAVEEDLAWLNPFRKFLCIKGVVFLTFWQGLAISILAEATDVSNGGNQEQWARSAQNFLICLEMLLFSIAHFYCFPTEEWEEGYRVKRSRGAFGETIALGDFLDDLKLVLRNSGGKKKKKPAHPPIPEGDEEQVTESDDSGATGYVAASTGDAGTAATVVSVASSCSDDNTIEDTERAIAEALEESLGAVNDDPDIAEAKKRLLESNVLRPEFFEPGDDHSRSLEDNDADGNGEREKTNESLAGAGNGNNQEHMKEMVDVENSDSREQEEARESTGLLFGGTNSAVSELLRPSIFTTVASLAESERQAGKGKKSKNSS